MKEKFLPTFAFCMCIHTVSLYQCLNTELCKTIAYMRITSLIKENEISLTWDFNSTNTFYGFQVKMMNLDKEVFYNSPILHISNMRMNFLTELPDSRSSICLQVLYNSSLPVGQTCNDIKINDLRIIVGILAGVVFLVPCALVLGVILYKDKQMRYFHYQGEGSGEQNNSYTSQEDLSSPTNQKNPNKHSSVLNGKTQNKEVQAKPVTEIIVENLRTVVAVLEHKSNQANLEQETEDAEGKQSSKSSNKLSVDAVEKQSSKCSSQEDKSSVYVIRL